MSSAEPGLFGKLPSHGDFLTRRLPRDFLDVWDEWLQAGVAASRTVLGEDAWLSAYLTAPVWCFALDPGICGGRGWAGVLMPSVDRVGRYYPLTVAVELAPGCTPAEAALTGADWFDRARIAALEALEAESLELEAFDAAVQALGAVCLAPAPALLLPVPTDGSPGLRLPLDPAGPPATLQRLAAGWLCVAFRPAAIWWTEGSERVEPMLLWDRALPRADSFASFLTGEWHADD